MAYRTLKPIFIDNAQDISVNFTGNPFSIEAYDRACLSIIATGTAAGTITVQASNDYVPPSQYINPSENPANWCDIPLGLNALISGGGHYLIDFTETGIPWLRINYVATSGVGTLTSIITAKEY